MADFLPPVTALLEASVDQFLEKMGVAKESLSALTDEPTTVDVRANTDDADAKIDRFDEKLAAIPNDERVKVDVDTAEADAKLDELKRKADSASGRDGSGDGLSGIVTAALTLGPALVPLAGVATGAILTIGGAFAAAGAGLGAFGLAAGKSLTTVEAQAKKTLTDWQNSMQSIVAPVIEKFGQLVAPALAAITPLVSAIVPALSGVASGLANAFASPALHQFVAFLASQAGPAISAFSGFFGDVLTGIGGMLEQTGPLLADFEGALGRIGGDIASFGTSQTFQSFVAYIQQNLPLVKRTLDDVGKAVGDIVKAAAPLGTDVLKALDKFARIISDISSHDPKLLTAGIAIAGIAAAASKLGGYVKSVYDMAAAIGALAGAETGADAAADANPFGLIVLAIAAVAAAAYEIHKHWNAIWADIKQWTADAVSFIKAKFSDLENAFPPLRDAADYVRDHWRNAWDDIENDVQTAIDKMKPVFDRIVTDVEDAFNKVKGFIQNNWPATLLFLVNPIAGTVLLIKSHLADIVAEFKKLPGQIGDALATGNEDLAKAGVGMMAGLYVGLYQGRNLILGWFKTLAQDSGQAIASSNEFMIKAGSNMDLALYKGLFDGRGQILGWFKTLVQGIIETSVDLPAWGLRILAGMEAGLYTGKSKLLNFFLQLPAEISTALGSVETWLLKAGADVIGGFLKGVGLSDPQLTAWFKNLPARILADLANPASWLLGVGLTAIDGLLAGVENAATNLWTWFTNLPTRILGLVASAGTWLLATGVAVISGFLTGGIIPAAASVWSWFTSLPGRIEGLVASAGSWLLSAGEAVIRGFLNGITSAVSSVTSYLGGLRDQVTSPFSDAIGWLYGAGQSIVQGLVAGIESEAGSVASSIAHLAEEASGVGAIISAIKAASPSKLYAEVGKFIPQGLAQGITDNLDVVTAALVSMAQKTGEAEEVKSILGINSPSTKFATEVGLPIVLGIAAGISSGAASIQKALVGVLNAPGINLGSIASNGAASMQKALFGVLNAAPGLNLGLGGWAAANAALPPYQPPTVTLPGLVHMDSSTGAAPAVAGGGGDLVMQLDGATLARVAGPQLRTWLLQTKRSTVNLGLS